MLMACPDLRSGYAADRAAGARVGVAPPSSTMRTMGLRPLTSLPRRRILQVLGLIVFFIVLVRESVSSASRLWQRSPTSVRAHPIPLHLHGDH